MLVLFEEKPEYTTGPIRRRTSEKDRQHNSQKKKRQWNTQWSSNHQTEVKPLRIIIHM